MLISLLHNQSGVSLSGWINTGPTEDGHTVTLRRVRFSRLPGLDTPKLTTSFSVFYASQEYWNPQSTNNALEHAVSANQVIIGWKGDVIVVKHGCHCSSCFTDISKEDWALCDAIVTAAVYNGHMY